MPAYAQLTKIRHYWHFVSLEMFHFFATKVLGLAREESGHRFGSFSMESLPDDLWRLSLAIPDLRIHMHSDEDGNDFERAASMHWWHARCGHDWWDFVFFAPPPEDYIF